MTLLNQVKTLFQRETVFCVSLVLALLSALAVPPDGAYLSYPDYRTLALLFCLMTVVAGARSQGAFQRLGRWLLRRSRGLRELRLALVMLCFFASMAITNDVALITFVPFTLMVFRMTGRPEQSLLLVVLETIAANLGSMATPIGNPQNLYLCSAAGLTMAQFARAVLPYAGLSLVLLLAVLLLQRDEPLGEERPEEEGEAAPLSALAPYLLLLALCLLVVFRVVGFVPVLLCVAAVVLAVNRRLFRSVDYFLLLTFLCFFIFIGNLKRIPALNDLLLSLVGGHELLAGILASQVISNVPAAVLLSGFTADWRGLLIGTNVGGLGTPIASLASLISLKGYLKSPGARPGRYLLVFTAANVVGIAVLCLTVFLLPG